MVENIWIITCLIYLTRLPLIAAQLPETESLRNVTECDNNANINLSCGADKVIAIHSLQFAYNVLCETTCCHTYDSSHCLEQGDSTDIQDVRRLCSGSSSCSVPPLKETNDFCALGVKPVSYVFLQYYCIPNIRKVSICDTSKSLTSDDAPLYITNENYPGVTTGSDSCSCSLEAYSCSSSIIMYIIDADLYHKTNSCEQNLVFKNGTDATLKTIGCDNYYTDIASSNIGSHFSKIYFINNSTSNQEGLFFIGLKASEAGVTFRLDCTSGPETWCIGCGALQNITNGNIELSNGSVSSYGAQADVNCDSGYETSTPSITCPANGSWPDAACTPKDCGVLQNITNGNIELSDGSNSSYGAQAVISCDNGYETSTPIITCPASGYWPDAVCTPKDCGALQNIPNGNIKLSDGSNSSYGAQADVNCDNGFETSTPTITCPANGSWPDAVCTPKDCGALQNIPNGNIELSDGSNSSYGAQANVNCDNGYETSTPTITCLAIGSWPDAVCTPKDACTANQWRCTNGDCIADNVRCDNFPDCQDESDEQNCTVSPVCPEGLESCLHFNGSSFCVDKAVGCVCDTAQVIENGALSLRDNSTKGSVADITCNNGYVTSTPNVTCLSSGLWEPASCIGIDCGAVPTFDFGTIVLTDSNNKTFGATARVVCTDGYLASMERVMCQSTGAWQSASCVIKDCGPVPMVNFGSVTLDNENKTTFAATASVTCRTGYYTSKKTIICQASGQWEKPMCEIKVTTTASSGGAEEKKSPLNLLLIIVLVVLAVIIIAQLLIVSFLQCKIYAIRRKGDDKNAEFPKRLLMIIAGSIPILGLIAIYFSWKVFNREVYHEEIGYVTKNKGHQYETTNSKIAQNDNLSMNGISIATSNPIYAVNGSNNILHEGKDQEEAINLGSIQLEGPEKTASDASHEENPPTVHDSTNEEDGAKYDQFKNDLLQETERSTHHAKH